MLERNVLRGNHTCFYLSLSLPLSRTVSAFPNNTVKNSATTSDSRKTDEYQVTSTCQVSRLCYYGHGRIFVNGYFRLIDITSKFIQNRMLSASVHLSKQTPDRWGRFTKLPPPSDKGDFVRYSFRNIMSQNYSSLSGFAISDTINDVFLEWNSRLSRLIRIDMDELQCVHRSSDINFRSEMPVLTWSAVAVRKDKSNSLYETNLHRYSYWVPLTYSYPDEILVK